RNGNVDAHVSIRDKFHAFGFHLLDAAIDQMLLHLEIRDAVAEQASDPVPLLEQRDIVTGARQLLGRCESRRTRADYRHALPGVVWWRLRMNPAFTPRMIDDRLLDYLNRDRRLIDAENTRRLTRCRTNA